LAGIAKMYVNAAVTMTPQSIPLRNRRTICLLTLPLSVLRNSPSSWFGAIAPGERYMR